MAIDRFDPRTWHGIELDPSLRPLAENPHFYDGDVRKDLALMQACGLALQDRFAEARLCLRFEDDGTMHLEVTGPGVRSADIFVLEGRFLVCVEVEQPGELEAEVATPAEVVSTLEAR